MTRLLLDLEIDAACDEYLRARGVTGQPQPVVYVLDAEPEDDWQQRMRAVNDLGCT